MLLSYTLDAGLNRHNLDTLSEIHLDHKTISYKDLIGSGKNKMMFPICFRFGALAFPHPNMGWGAPINIMKSGQNIMGWGTPTQNGIARPHPHTQLLQPGRAACNRLHMARNELILKLDEAVCISMVSRPNWTQTRVWKVSNVQQK